MTGVFLCLAGIVLAAVGVVVSLRAQDTADPARAGRLRALAVTLYAGVVLATAAGLTLVLTQRSTP